MSTVKRPLLEALPSRPTRPALVALAREYWYVWLVLVASAIQVVSLWRVLHPVTPGSYPPLKDSVIFEYIGWYLAEGARLYVDVWEVKPPLAFEVPGLLALAADGDVWRYHALVLVVTNVAVVGGSLVVGLLTLELSGDELAALAAGLALFALPVFHWRAAFGFKAKYFVVLFGLLAVYLARRERPFLAGAAAAASVGFWQLALVFPALALGLATQRGGRRAVAWTVGGGGLVTALVLAPVVWWGAIDAMVAEVVLTPLLVTNDGGTVADQIGYAARLLGRTLPLALLGAFGVAAGVRRDPRGRWWVAAGGAWFALQLLALDLDLYPDLIPVFPFVALGIGLALGDRRGAPASVYGLVGAMVVLSVVTIGPLTVADPVSPPAVAAVDAPYRGGERPALLWRSIEAETCRPFFGETQRKVIDLTGGSLDERTCGAVEPLWDAMRSRLVGPTSPGPAPAAPPGGHVAR